MVKLSNHTRLMNIMMGLCQEKPIPKWPNTLKDLKYQISCIEVNIPKSHPDIIFQNKHANHAIFLDCKSETLKEKQIEKYDEIRKNPTPAIASGKISVIHKDQFKLDPTICSFSDLSNEELINKYDMLFLHILESGKLYNEVQEIQLKKGQFSYSEINKVFPIDTSNSVPPYFLYPFDQNDFEIFMIELLKYLQQYSLSKKEFTEDDLLSKSHKMWKYIDNKTVFRKKTHSLLIELQQKGLNKNLKKRQDKWFVDVKSDGKSQQAFQSRCIRIEKQLTKKGYQDILNLT